MSAVGEVLDKLTSGQMDIDQAAQAFTDMPWPTRPAPGRTLAQIEADPDPVANEEGDFAEVESAYVNGDISLEQYEKLAAATMGTDG